MLQSIMKKYGKAQFYAGFYLALSLLEDDDKVEEILLKYKKLMEHNIGDVQPQSGGEIIE